MFTPRNLIDSNWLKILFDSNNPLHPLELIELQQLILNNQKQVTDYLVSPYFIVSGCGFNFISSTATDVTFQICRGTVYIEGRFLNLAETTLTCDRTSIHEVRLNPVISQFSNSQFSNLAITKNPHLPQTQIHGIQGADREVYEVNITLDTDGYPLYRLDFTDLNIVKRKVEIFFQDHYQDVNNITSITIAKQSKLLNNLEHYWQSERKNYILHGLTLDLPENSDILLISPGYAFISGRKVCFANPQYLDLTQYVTEIDRKYFVKFNLDGKIRVNKYIYDTEINLGTIVLEGSTVDPATSNLEFS